MIWLQPPNDTAVSKRDKVPAYKLLAFIYILMARQRNRVCQVGTQHEQSTERGTSEVEMFKEQWETKQIRAGGLYRAIQGIQVESYLHSERRGRTD